MRIICAAAFAALFAFWGASKASAQDVLLTSRDGSLEISGTLLTYDGELYRVDTVYGVLTVDGTGVTCEGPGCPDLTRLVSELRIAGARTMGEVLVPALVEAFAVQKGYGIERRFFNDDKFEYVLTEADTGAKVARVAFQVSSTEQGFFDLINDEADIALSTREATPEEITRARQAEIGDLSVPRRFRVLALDALVPIVARENPLTELGFEELTQIVSGEISSWDAIDDGIEPREIRLHLRDSASGLAAELARQVLDPVGGVLPKDAVLHPDNVSLVEAVERDPHALGFAIFSETGNARRLDILGACGKRARASAADLKTRDYPLTTPLFVYSPVGRPSPIAREFGAYMRSSAAQPVIARAGFVDLRVAEVSLAAQGQRLANAITAAGEEITLEELQRLAAVMDGTSRLTLGFRFETGGSRLDAQSRSNVEILGAELETGRFDGRTLIFVGFSDGDGAAAGNLRLARRRAEAVRRAVLRAAPAANRERIEVAVEAFGEAMPMACDTSDWGRQINRRVEVWVK